MKRTQKPLTQDELQRYERALILWEQGLKKETADLDAREAELEAREKALGIEWDDEDTESIYALPTENVRNALEDAGRFKPKSLVFDDGGCTITPQEFVTTIQPCGQKCYEGEHTTDCARMIYLEVERLGNL
jgi:hypothetical protein